MPRAAALVSVCLLLGLAAFAAAHDPTVPGGDSVRVILTEADCRRLVKHVPAPDVAYSPGVDVDGDPVVPADLDGGVRIELPETFAIPIEVELFERLGIPSDPARFDADLVVGEVTVDIEGRAYFNGQPLQDEAAAELAAKCQRVLRGGE